MCLTQCCIERRVHVIIMLHNIVARFLFRQRTPVLIRQCALLPHPSAHGDTDSDTGTGTVTGTKLYHKRQQQQKRSLEAIARIHASIRICIHAYVHTYVHTYTYMHPSILTCIPTNTYKQTYIHTYIHTYISPHSRRLLTQGSLLRHPLRRPTKSARRIVRLRANLGGDEEEAAAGVEFCA